MGEAEDLGKKTANDVRELHSFYSTADEVYRLFRTQHLEDTKATPAESRSGERVRNRSGKQIPSEAS